MHSSEAILPDASGEFDLSAVAAAPPGGGAAADDAGAQTCVVCVLNPAGLEV